MITSKSGVFIIITNKDEYTLTMQKTKCVKPEGLYEIELAKVFKEGETVLERFFMTEEELGYFARALIC